MAGGASDVAVRTTQLETAEKAQRACGGLFAVPERTKDTEKREGGVDPSSVPPEAPSTCRPAWSLSTRSRWPSAPSPRPLPKAPRPPIGHRLLFPFRTSNVYKQALFSVLIIFST